MKVPPQENSRTNANAGTETASPDTGQMMSAPAFGLTAGPAVANETVQLAANDTDPGEAVTDASFYYVSKSDANIRSDANPASVTSAKIPIGTKMKDQPPFLGSRFFKRIIFRV